LSAAIAFGFFWAGLERFLLYLLARYPCLRERLEHWKHIAAARGKNFDFIEAFSVPLSRSASIFVRNKQKVVSDRDDAHRSAPASVKELATERAARLAVENFDRKRDRERAAQKVGMLW
jgi:phosphopantothenate synthetase